MMAHKIKRIPIIDADGRLVGMVGRAGVLAALSRGT
jgi:CBS domain-containing protein